MFYLQVYDRALCFGSWVLDRGVASGKANNIIGIFAQNRPEVGQLLKLKAYYAMIKMQSYVFFVTFTDIFKLSI